MALLLSFVCFLDVPEFGFGNMSAASFAAPSRSSMPAADARPVPARDQSPPRKSILAIFWDPANPAFCPDIPGQSVSLSMPYPCALESAGFSTPSGSPICCTQRLPCAAGSRPLVGSCEYCHSLSAVNLPWNPISHSMVWVLLYLIPLYSFLRGTFDAKPAPAVALPLAVCGDFQACG